MVTYFLCQLRHREKLYFWQHLPIECVRLRTQPKRRQKIRTDVSYGKLFVILDDNKEDDESRRFYANDVTTNHQLNENWHDYCCESVSTWIAFSIKLLLLINQIVTHSITSQRVWFDDDKSSSVMFSDKIAGFAWALFTIIYLYFRWAEEAAAAAKVTEHVFWNLNEALLNRMTIRRQVHAVVAKWD